MGPENMESLESRLERGGVIVFPTAPFPLPEGEDQEFLLRQQRGSRSGKYATYNPGTGKFSGPLLHDSGDTSHPLADICRNFSQTVTAWLPEVLPHYQSGLDADRVTFRPEEEATRSLRPNARNDLLHVDAFPGRPARGRRILRLFTNIHPSESRVWVTSEPLPRILPRYREEIQRRFSGIWTRLGATMLDLLSTPENRQLPSDRFMRSLHDYLKANNEFQRHSTRRLWHFPPGSAWLVMTDGCTYAELRGRHALEHSFFVRPEVLVHPELAPEALFRAA